MLYFSIQNCRRDRTGKLSEAAGARWRFYPRIIVGLSSNRLYIGGSTSGTFTWDLQLQDFVAGAIFGEVGGWLYLLRALEMTLHMGRRSLLTFILCGRRSIWGGWRVTLFAPRIGNDVSYTTQITDDIHFVWQAQYLVRLEGKIATQIFDNIPFVCQAQYFGGVACDFSWQAQHFVTFWEIAGARNVVFFNTKLSTRSHGKALGSGGCEITILSSDYHRIILESSLYWQKHFRHFYLRSTTSRFRGRRSIWWG